MHGKHLTIRDREVMAKMLAQGAHRTAIAKALGVHRTSIGREWKRNGSEGDYFPSLAQAAADARRARSKSPWKMELPAIGEHVREGLQAYWSPEQIAGRLRRTYPDDASMQISHTCIYAWIYRMKANGRPWQTYLRQGHRKRRKRYGTGEKRGRIPGRVGIEHRPAIVEARSRFGDWESDTVEGGGRIGGHNTYLRRPRSRDRYCVPRS